MTAYPFPIPANLMTSLPFPSRDGNHYLDVRVAGKWDGVIVVDRTGMCIGVYIRGRIEEYPLPFAPTDIEDIRQASLGNRMLAALPSDLYTGAVLTVVVFSPIHLILGWLVLPFFALLSVLACAWAIYTLYLEHGFPFTRFPVAVGALCQIVSGCLLLVRSLL